MASLQELIANGTRIDAHRGAPRAEVDTSSWISAGRELQDGRLNLLGLWGEGGPVNGSVHMALLEPAAKALAVLSLACPSGRFPSIGCLHAPAIRLERTIQDLYGLDAEDAFDRRPWLDHSRAYEFLSAEGEHLHQIPVGPVHAGIIESGHFRFTAGGETVVRLEERLGYVHKGIEKLMARAPLDRAAQLAGRVSGDSTVAYAIAFARAVEAALDIVAPARAVWLRALMAEVERIANHFGDIGAICNDASFGMMLAHCGVLRERVLRAADTAFSHRLMRDIVVPGGVAKDIDASGIAAIRALVAEAEQKFPPLIRLYDDTASLQDRTVGTGILRAELAGQFAAGGYVGRASGRSFDARRDLVYAPYHTLNFEVPVRHEGDVNARVWIRIREVQESLKLIAQILDRLPGGETRIGVPSGMAGEGIAIVEGFRGDILVWLRIGVDGTIECCHPRDPSWFQWPLLEVAIEGNIVADFPLCNKSFNCSYSGHDL